MGVCKGLRRGRPAPCRPAHGAQADAEGLSHSMASEGGGSRQMKDGHWEAEKEGRLNPFISPPPFFLFPIPLSSSSPFSLLSPPPHSPFFRLFFLYSLPLSFLLFPSLFSSPFLFLHPLLPLPCLSSCVILDCVVQTDPVVTRVYVLNPNAARRSHARSLSVFDHESPQKWEEEICFFKKRFGAAPLIAGL